MRDESILHGAWGGSEEPDWGPLEKILPLGLCGPFMYMSEVELDGGGYLCVYKHSVTRRYFHLDEDGAPYRYADPDLYVPLRHYDAVELVFTPSWLLHDAEDGDDELLKQALASAIERDDAERARGVDPGPL
jgi:hypothetical protein